MRNFRARSPLNHKPKIREETNASGEEMVIVTSLMTNKETDGHGTHFSDDSIDNFEKAENLTLLDSHNHDNTGYGTSTRIWREGDDIYGDFAIFKKSVWSNKLTYPNAEALIYDLRNRHFDTSIGFANDADICDLCLAADQTERDIWYSEDCDHLLNDMYGEQRATAELRGGKIYENSLVYAGSNHTSHIISEEQREASIEKCERMLKDGRTSIDSIMKMSRSLQIPELRKVGTTRQVFIPDKQRGIKPMPKTTEGLEARVEELEEEVKEATEAKDEIKELYNAERTKNRELKLANRELTSKLETLTELEDGLRDECRKADKEAEKLRKEEERKSEEEQEEFETELKQMSYSRLQRALKKLNKERDILIEINKVENPDGSDDVTIPEADENKPVQPYMARGELNARYL